MAYAPSGARDGTGGVTEWSPRRRPPLRRCLDCGGDCYGWSESTRCRRCARRLAERGPLELEPGGIAEEARRLRLARREDAGVIESGGYIDGFVLHWKRSRA